MFSVIAKPVADSPAYIRASATPITSRRHSSSNNSGARPLVDSSMNGATNTATFDSGRCSALNTTEPPVLTPSEIAVATQAPQPNAIATYSHRAGSNRSNQTNQATRNGTGSSAISALAVNSPKLNPDSTVSTNRMVSPPTGSAAIMMIRSTTTRVRARGSPRPTSVRTRCPNESDLGPGDAPPPGAGAGRVANVSSGGSADMRPA